MNWMQIAIRKVRFGIILKNTAVGLAVFFMEQHEQLEYGNIDADCGDENSTKCIL